MVRNWKRWCLAMVALAGFACDDSPTAVRHRSIQPNKDIDVSTGTLSLQLQFAGTALSALKISTPWNCALQVYMDPTPPANPNGTYVHSLCGSDFSAAAVSIGALPLGDHTFQVIDVSQNYAVLGSGQASLVGGQTTSLALDFGQSASLVKGTLVANGAVPTPNEYVVCPVANDCSIVSSSDGTFAYLDLPG